MEYYTVVELSTVLGITDAALRQKIRAQELPSMQIDRKISISTEDFEDYLAQNRCWDFIIAEWQQYRETKRPIKQQFTKIPGALLILNEYGISIEQRTLKRWISNKQIKAYNLGGTFYIPIEVLHSNLSS